MKYLFAIVLLAGFFITPAFAQDVNNPSVIIDTIEIPAEEFNIVLRDTTIIPLDGVHAASWQVTVDTIYFMLIRMEMLFFDYMIKHQFSIRIY